MTAALASIPSQIDALVAGELAVERNDRQMQMACGSDQRAIEAPF